ncbi:oligosaccharide flippase family protein [Streptomyces sp. MS191]|uniref:oligosaccharide flippase family protein n=1 Tax=Streptomyces sp. ms191 TaxID=1827978 RepID=UPI00164F0D44|nr:oligosaccharide flippase family protein [Streptomyces sp. ms191]
MNPGEAAATPAAEPPDGRARHALRGLLWNYAGSAATIVLQLAYTACTARIVSPAAFGAFATAVAVSGVLGYFANGGVATCLLTAERLTRQLITLVLRIGAVSGVLCCLATQAVTPVVTALWDMPDVAPLLRLIGLQFLVLPAALAATAALRRCGRTAQVVRLELAGNAVGAATALVLLAAEWAPFALAVPAPLGTAVLLAGALRLLRRQDLPDGERPRARGLVDASGFFSAFSLSQYLCNNAPLWLAGRLGASAAGYHSRATLFTALPLTVLAQGIGQAATPVLAADRGRSRQAVSDVLCLASAIGFVGFGVLAGLGPAALDVLLGPGWGVASRLVPLLSAGSAVALVVLVGDNVNQARDDRRSLLVCQAWAAAAIAVALAAVVARDSLPLLAAATLAGPLAGHTAQLLRWRAHGVVAPGPLLRVHAVHLAAGGLLALAGHLGAAAGGSPAHRLLLGCAAVLAVLVCAAPLRARLPLYAVAVRHGLLPRPSPWRSRGRSAPRPARQQ